MSNTLLLLNGIFRIALASGSIKLLSINSVLQLPFEIFRSATIVLGGRVFGEQGLNR